MFGMRGTVQVPSLKVEKELFLMSVSEPEFWAANWNELEEAAILDGSDLGGGVIGPIEDLPYTSFSKLWLKKVWSKS